MNNNVFRRAVIIGAHGQLGRALVEVFADTDPIGLTREHLNLEYVDSIEDVLVKCDPSLVILAAAITDVDWCEQEENKHIALMVNGVVPGTIAKWCRVRSLPFITYSSDYVFPGGNRSYNEISDCLKPLNYYGTSKVVMELLCKNAFSYIIRTSLVFGEGNNFVKAILNKARQSQSMSVVNDQVSSATYAVDLAKHTRQMIEHQYQPGLYHMVNTGALSRFDLARRCIEIAKISCNVIPVSTEEYYKQNPPPPGLHIAKRPDMSILANNKLPSLRFLEEALKEYIPTLL